MAVVIIPLTEAPNESNWRPWPFRAQPEHQFYYGLLRLLTVSMSQSIQQCKNAECDPSVAPPRTSRCSI